MNAEKRSTVLELAGALCYDIKSSAMLQETEIFCNFLSSPPYVLFLFVGFFFFNAQCSSNNSEFHWEFFGVSTDDIEDDIGSAFFNTTN